MARSPKLSSGTTPGGGVNERSATKQSRFFWIATVGVAGLLIVLSIFMNKSDPVPEIGPGGARERLTDASARNPGDAEAFKGMSDRMEGLAKAFTEQQEKAEADRKAIVDLTAVIQAQGNPTAILLDEVDSLRLEMSLMQQELLDSRAQIKPDTGRTGSSGGILNNVGGPVPRSPAPHGFGGNPRGTSSQASSLGLDIGRREQTVLSIASDVGTAAVQAFDEKINGDLTSAKEPGVFSTKDYVPPNAYAPAIVYVGVDAATGKASQTDPQAAAFLITGPASHVVINGEIQTTNLKGCIVNGAARGDLSTERVFIKLQKMTCPLEGGRVAVQNVEGHVTHLGKAGVRGRIVSRVGDRVNKAAIASALSGLGSALGGAGRGGASIGGAGGIIQEVPNAEELAIASGGGAVSGAADTLASYYIEQAKAIEAVVSMPTGVNVELVFINGFKARPTPKPVGASQ